MKARTLVVRGLLSLVVLSLLAVTLQSLVFSAANFADAGETSASVVAGSVSHTNSAAGTFVLNAEYLRPGLSAQGSLTITGGSDVPATYTITRVSLADAPAAPALSGVLQLRIDDATSGATLYDGVAGGFTSAYLGLIAEGEVRQIVFTLTYPLAAADRALQGASMTMQVEFAGVSL